MDYFLVIINETKSKSVVQVTFNVIYTHKVRCIHFHD